jgi:hypothetical protein
MSVVLQTVHRRRHVYLLPEKALPDPFFYQLASFEMAIVAEFRPWLIVQALY